MRHEAPTEEEIAKSGLLPEGVYDFEITSAKEETSSAGNEMFSLKLKVYDKEGIGRSIFDWVMPTFKKKFKHIHDACGLMDTYNSKQTSSDDLIGKSGKLILAIGKPYKDKNGLERINNTVEDYIKKDSTEQYNKAALPQAVIDDEIPFG